MFAVCGPQCLLSVNHNVCCLWTAMFAVCVDRNVCCLWTPVFAVCGPQCLLSVDHNVCCLWTTMFAVCGPVFAVCEPQCLLSVWTTMFAVCVDHNVHQLYVGVILSGTRGDLEEASHAELSKVADSLTSHQYKSYMVMMVHRLRANTEVQLGRHTVCVYVCVDIVGWACVCAQICVCVDLIVCMCVHRFVYVWTSLCACVCTDLCVCGPHCVHVCA